MRLQRKLFGAALGASLLFAGASYASAGPLNWHGERQEQTARDEIRRGELMEQKGRQMESAGQWRRGQAMERRGQNLERHGRQMLNAAERHEHVYGYR
jgi:hypothetical protein